MIKFIATTVVALSFTTPVLAWGDREQGALAGIVGTLLWQRLDNHSQPQPRPQVIFSLLIIPKNIGRPLNICDSGVSCPPQLISLRDTLRLVRC